MLVYDLKGKAHDKEPVDVRECVEILGWKMDKPVRKPRKRKVVKPKEVDSGLNN